MLQEFPQFCLMRVIIIEFFEKEIVTSVFNLRV